MVNVILINNQMPIYKLQCLSCNHTEEVFFGKALSSDVINITCKKCNYRQMKKIPEPINTANFSSGSRKSLKTRTGVGELQFIQGAEKIVDKANK